MEEALVLLLSNYHNFTNTQIAKSKISNKILFFQSTSMEYACIMDDCDFDLKDTNPFYKIYDTIYGI